MNNIDLNALAGSTGKGLVYLAIALAAMWVAKCLADYRTRRVCAADDEVNQRGNVAMGFRRAGGPIAIGIAMLGPLMGPDKRPFSQEVLLVLADVALILVWLAVARYLNDRFIVSRLDNDAAVKDGNVAVALTEFGSAVATGLILAGSFAGEGGGVLSSIAFAVIGQIFLIVLVVAYDAISPIDVVRELCDNNIAAGMRICGLLVGLGVILWASIAGDSAGWRLDLLSFSTSAVIGAATVFLLLWLVDLILVPNITINQLIRDRNAAGMLVPVFANLAFAILIAVVII